MALIFGIVSPKIMTSTVRIIVASHAYSSPPVTSMTATEASDDAPILARLLPIRIALSASSKCSVIYTAIFARFEPSSRAFSRRMTLHDENAISDAEQKLDRHRHRKMPANTRTVLIVPRPPSLEVRARH